MASVGRQCGRNYGSIPEINAPTESLHLSQKLVMSLIVNMHFRKLPGTAFSDGESKTNCVLDVSNQRLIFIRQMSLVIEWTSFGVWIYHVTVLRLSLRPSRLQRDI